MLHSFSRIPKKADAPPPNVNFNGRWVNELGSSMRLTVTATGEVTGIYKTAVGSPTQDEEFRLVGFASDDLISFTVDFGNYGSLTGWVGQHTDDGQGAIIKTMWLLAENVPDPEEAAKLWGSVLTGYNNFTR